MLRQNMPLVLKQYDTNNLNHSSIPKFHNGVENRNTFRGKCAFTLHGRLPIFRRMSTNELYAEDSSIERNPNVMFVHNTVTVRFPYGDIRPTKLWTYLDDLRTYK